MFRSDLRLQPAVDAVRYLAQTITGEVKCCTEEYLAVYLRYTITKDGPDWSSRLDERTAALRYFHIYQNDAYELE